MTDSDDLETRLRSLSIDRKADGQPQVRRRLRVWPYIALIPLVASAITLMVSSDLRRDMQLHLAALLPASETRSTAPVRADDEARQTRSAAASTDQDTQRPGPNGNPAAPTASSQPKIIGSGHVVASRSVVLKSRIGGRVEQIKVRVGDHVKAGTPLLSLSRKAAEIDLALARERKRLVRARLDGARADHAVAQAAADRLEELVARGAGRRADGEDAALRLVRLVHAIEIEQSQLAAAGLEEQRAEMHLSQHVLRAPFDAVVVNMPAATGMLISSGESGGSDGAGLMTLMDVSRLFVDVEVAERNIASISHGQQAEIRLDAFPDRPLDAEVISIEPRASRERATITVRLALGRTNIPEIRPNMSAKATFVAPSDRTRARLSLTARN